jgi:quinol monooxygenase YgiN
VILRVLHHVRDYDAWRVVFDEHRDVREQHGALGHAVYRDMGDPNLVTILNRFPSAAHAEAFMRDPSLREAMQRAGVDSEPDIAMLDTVDELSYQTAAV